MDKTCVDSHCESVSVCMESNENEKVIASASVSRGEVGQLALKLLCLMSSVTCVILMVTARQSSTVSIFGFPLPVSSKWSFSDSFQYLVGVSATVATQSLLQLILSLSTIFLKRPCSILSSNSRKHAWLLFASDQVLAYAMISAGSAATSVGNLNRSGIKHTALPFPHFCNSLNIFCHRVAISISFSFFTFLLLSISAIQHLIFLSNN